MPSKRDQIKLSDEEIRDFLVEQRIMQVVSFGPNGRPHLMPLWYLPEITPPSLREGGGHGFELRGWTYAKSQKAKNLERDPRATIGIDAGVAYHELRGVMMECDVELIRETDRIAEIGVALFTRYGPGGALAPEVAEMVEAQAGKRVGLHFVPTRTVSWDHSKLGGAY
jgi:Pyridoxamine 5'-phosphate oxidase